MFLHTLPAAARQLLSTLAQLEAVHDFYLAGGSAAALLLGHRVSVDLDFFCPRSYEPDFLLQQLSSAGRLAIQQQSPGTLLGILNDVRVSFFTYPYPMLESRTICEGVQVASLLDIGLMKWIAIGQRGRKRDFVDLYFVSQGGHALSGLLQRMPAKYPEISYPAYHLIRALTYFDDAEQDPAPQMLVAWDWNAIKKFFEREAVQLIKSLG